MSKAEFILTALAYIACVAFLIRYTIPHMLEWLEAMSIDETTEGREHHDA